MKQIQLPLVSVIMPVYNAGKFLPAAIESVVKQTYPRLELIIVDDASTDNSWEIIKKYKKLHPDKIKAFKIDKQTNAAGNGATNFVMSHAKGEFVARMDSDDISLPKRIEKQVNYLMSHPRVIVLGTQATVIDGRGRILGQKNVTTEHEKIYRQLAILNPLIHPSIMFRRSLLPNPDKIYAMKYGNNDDYYTFFKLLSFGLFANLPEALIKYRLHGANASLSYPKASFRNSIKIRLEAITQLNYHMSLPALSLMIVQMLVVPAIPERFVLPFYLFTKGIKKISFKPFLASLPQTTIAKLAANFK